MTASRRHADPAARGVAFTCPQELFTPDSFAMTAIRAIRERGRSLPRLTAAPVRETDAPERENARLRERNAEPERSAALGSTAGPKPPASDGLKKSGTREKRARSRRGRSGRPSGGRPGHKGTAPERTAAPDHVVGHDPCACAGCGAPLPGADRHGDPVCRQVFDVPGPPPLEVTGHRGHRCLCGAVTAAAFPNGVSAPVRYGPRIAARVTCLPRARFIPGNRVAGPMNGLFAARIPTAAIAAMGRRTARRFEGFPARAADIIRTAAPVRRLDGTGIRIAARTRWLHALRAPLLAVLRTAAGRSRTDGEPGGIAIHDGCATCFAPEGVRHGACSARHLRELQALTGIGKEAWATSMHRPLTRAGRASRFARKNDRNVPAPLAALISRARDRILERAIASHEKMPPLRTGKRGRKKRRIGHSPALRLRTRKEGCLRFLTDPRTPFSDSQAERDPGTGRLRRKISGRFRSTQGARDSARLGSVIATARKQGWNALETLARPDPRQLIAKLRL